MSNARSLSIIHQQFRPTKSTHKYSSLKAVITVCIVLVVIVSVTVSRQFGPSWLHSLSRTPTPTAASQSPWLHPLQSPDEDDDDPAPIRCEKISAQEDKCAFVTANCPSDGLFNYLDFRYCTLSKVKNATVLSVFIFAVLLLILLKSMGATADVAFVPSLELISAQLKLSPGVSGLTLIALGNSAPDILTSITSVKKGASEGDLGLVLGSLAGSSLCIGCLVLGLAIITAYKIKPSMTAYKKKDFIRAMIGLILCSITSICLCAKASLRWWDGLILIGIYVVFVALSVVYLQRQEAKKQKAALEKRKATYIHSTSSFQVTQTSKSLKQNLLEMDDGRFDTADDVVGRQHNTHAAGIELNTYSQPNELGNINNQDYDQQQQLEMTPASQRGFSLRNLITQSARNLLDDDDEEEEEEEQKDSARLHSIQEDGIQYDSEGLPINQPSSGAEYSSELVDGDVAEDDDEEEDDQTYFMGGLMFENDWSKPNQTFVQRWVSGGFDKLTWILCLPISFLRWLSVPSCHHRPDYLRGPKRIALHASFFFTPLLFGLAFVGITEFSKVKLIWIILACCSVGLVIGCNLFYFYIVVPSVAEYNIRRHEIQEIVANKKEEDHLDDHELQKISQLIIQYEIDQDDEAARPLSMKAFMAIVACMAFLGSIAWLSLIAGELVEILSCIGVMFGISPLFLGLTVLSIGNSCLDLAANLGLAKRGKMNVAYASIFSAPVSASSFGLGVAILLTCLTSTAKISYKLSPSILLCWGAVIGSIILYCVLFPWVFNYKPNKKFGYILMGYYLAFLVAVIIFEVVF